MCGIVGFIDTELSSDERESVLRSMTATLVHRGPDDEGTWHDAATGVSLGHRRLSIIDLSQNGHQPMVSPSGRHVLTYNGEVYDFRTLREELAGTGWSFTGHSDTEVLLAAIETWGVERALQRCTGMLALALWDREARRLVLARDRLGIKPLYYGWIGRVFFFGSELKPLHQHPRLRPPIDRGALMLLMRHGYIPGPHSIFRGVRKLPPGHACVIDPSTPGGELRSTAYWSLDRVAHDAREHAFDGSDTDAIAELERTLGEAIERRMIADVPLGAFLSGGTDSSTVVSLMQARSPQPVRTFTIGYREADYDEAHHARRVADHLGTDHSELIVGAAEALDVIPRLSELYDEPFADLSQVPTFLVSRLARERVAVTLSGDGGDELFLGYQRHSAIHRIWRRIGWLPGPIRRGSGALLRRVPPRWANRALSWLAPVTNQFGAPGAVGDKLHKFAELAEARDRESAYLALMTAWKRPDQVVREADEPLTLHFDPTRRPAGAGLNEWMAYVDTLSYLPDDILTKLDRASMAVSLEARVPLLDHRVVELAWRMPTWLKVRNGESKWVLKQVLRRHLPDELVDRPKMGFGIPLGEWMRGPLRDWAEELLDEKRLREQGYFHAAPIRQRWRSHVAGHVNWQYSLWPVLMFQAWRDRWG